MPQTLRVVRPRALPRCLNRDWNAVKNMKKITDYWFKYGKRPIKYSRKYDFQSHKLKNSNPRKKASNRIMPNKKHKFECFLKGAILH